MVKTKIGKDVIDSITLSMYEDPLIIYREYIQNSADQIDIAVQKNILSSINEGTIEISVDKKSNTILVEDNATGIEADKVDDVLKNIAQSSKKRDSNKGFRGIGRLGGIAYCNRLIFETSYKGEAIKSTLIWDAIKLKTIINDRTKNEEATEVIDMVTHLETETEDVNSHYFKVKLEGVDNDRLLSIEQVREYLSMVAPVPYQKHFIFKDVIYERLKSENIQLDEYNIYVNNDKLEKAYTTSIYEGTLQDKKKIDEISELKFFPVYDKEENLLAYGWYGVSNFEKQIPPINKARGIRLRKSNIQIGDNSTLIPYFKEQRGNNYFYGEIFALDKNLIPNARRDNFVENDTLKSFQKSLVGALRDPLHKLYYYASNLRSAARKIENLQSFREEYEKKANEVGFSNKEEEEKYNEKFQELKEKAKSGEKDLEKLRTKINGKDDPKSKIFDKIAGEKPNVEDVNIDAGKQNGKTKFATDGLSKLSNKERKLVSKVFGIIDVVLTPDLADNLKEKIKTEFK